MTTLTILDSIVAHCTNFSLTPALSQATHESIFGGSEQVKDLLADRWRCSFAVAPHLHDDAAAIEAWFNRLRGRENDVSLWHFVRPEPRGTLRGSPTLASAASLGAETISVQTTAGATLLAGDMIGLAGQLHQVAADAVADGSGVMSVALINRLRASRTLGAAITWNRPTERFRASAVIPVSFGGSVTNVIDCAFLSLPEGA